MKKKSIIAICAVLVILVLASLVDISYKEETNGVVRVSVEGNEFVDRKSVV